MYDIRKLVEIAPNAMPAEIWYHIQVNLLCCSTEKEHLTTCQGFIHFFLNIVIPFRNYGNKFIY